MTDLIVVIAVGSRGAGHVANGGVDDNDHVMRVFVTCASICV